MVIRSFRPHVYLKCASVLVAVAGAVCGAGQLTKAPVLAQPLPNRATFTGRITDGNGVPVSGASVTLQRKERTGATGYWGTVTFTDAHGDYSFPDAEAGAYALSVAAGGFTPIYGRSVKVGDNGSGPAIRLEPLAKVTFQTLGADGQKLVKQPVAVLLRRTKGTDYVGPLVFRSATNDSGQVEFGDIVPGTYALLFVSKGNGYATVPEVDLLPARATPPVALKFQPGGRIHVTGQEIDTNAPIPRAQVLFQRITEFSPDAPIQGPGLESPLYQDGTVDFSTSQTTGDITLSDLVPGKYRVELNTRNGQPNAAQTVSVESGQTAEVTNRSGVDTRVRLDFQVNAKDGQPLANAPVTLTFSRLVQPAKTDTAPAQETFEQRLVSTLDTDATGKGVVNKLPQGHWKLSIRRGTEGKDSAAIEMDVAAEGGNVTLTVPE